MYQSLVGLFLFFTVSFASAEVENACCFCFADLSDDSTRTECSRWLRENSRRLECGVQETLLLQQYSSFPRDLTCNRVEAYTSFHGNSAAISKAIKIVEKISKDLKPREINYDGSTCNVFNHVDEVKTKTEILSQVYPEIRFNLQGNQNVGLVNYIRIISKPKETQSASSKMIIEAQNGLSEVTYGECTRPGRQCGVVSYDPTAKNNPNEKFCMENSEIKTQMCCPVKNKRWGQWNLVGEACS